MASLVLKEAGLADGTRYVTQKRTKGSLLEPELILDSRDKPLSEHVSVDLVFVRDNCTWPASHLMSRSLRWVAVEANDIDKRHGAYSAGIENAKSLGDPSTYVMGNYMDAFGL